MIGEFYVGDRNDGRDYKLLKRMDDDGCGFAIRLMEQAVVTPIKDLALRDEDREAGVVSDQIVRLGAAKRRSLEPVRVIRIEKPEREEPIIIVTNQLDPKNLSVRLVSEIYRIRWDIKLFFRWLKCIFGRPMQWHWLAESPRRGGYPALHSVDCLAATGEALRWHQVGVIFDAELAQALGLASEKTRD